MKKDLAIIVTEQDLARDVCDFFRSFETQLHEAFQWIAATRNSYRNYIDQLTPYTKGIALWEANSDIFSRAIAELNSRRRKKYAEGTLNTIRSVINDVCYFAEVYSQGRYRNSLWGTTWSASFDKKETPEKKIAHRLKIPKSLNMLEEIKLLNAAKEEYFHNSNAIGLAIMFYMGLRPGECAGLKYGDIRPLEGYPGVNCFYIHTQIRTTREKTNSLKTENAYRVLPIPKELDDMLRHRRSNIEKRVKDISSCPIVSKNETDGLTEYCNPNVFMSYCKNQLREAKVSEEVVLGAAREAKADGRGEAEATSYLLRRNYATDLLAVCGLEADEIKYLFGHAIYTLDESRRDYLNPDVLYRLWQKENIRSFFFKPKGVFYLDKEELSVHQKQATIVVPAHYIEAHPAGVILQIHNTDVNDRVKIIVQEGSPTSVRVLSFNQQVPMKRAERINIRAEFSEALSTSRKRSEGRSRKQD